MSKEDTIKLVELLDEYKRELEDLRSAVWMGGYKRDVKTTADLMAQMMLNKHVQSIDEIRKLLIFDLNECVRIYF